MISYMNRRCYTTQNVKYVIPLVILILIPFLRYNILVDSGSDIVNHKHLNNNLIRSSDENIIDEKNYAQYGYNIDSIVHLMSERIFTEFISDPYLSIFQRTNKLPDVKDQNSHIESNPKYYVNIGNLNVHKYTLGNAISPNDALNIIIVTKGRSGSSFLGELLSQYPGTFYSYEPLHYRMSTASIDEKVDLVKDVFKCTPNQDYIKHLQSWGSKPNFRYRDACLSLPEGSCFLPEVYTKSCQLFPIRLIKVIRFPYENAESLLVDPDMGKRLKIIFLFRDPRGRLNSVKNKMHWCAHNNCEVTQFCNDFANQVREAVNLKEIYSERVHIVRYEDLSLDPEQVSKELMAFLDLQKSWSIDHFIQNHTNGKNSSVTIERHGPVNTVRNSSREVFKWRNKIQEKDVSDIQELCGDSMKTLGYNPMTNIQSNRINESYALIKPLPADLRER